MVLGKLKDIALGVLALASGILFGFWQRSRSKRMEDQKDAAERQRDALTRANEASRKSGEEGREDVLKAKEKAARGEFDDLNKPW